MIHRFLFLLLISPVALFAQKPIFVDAKLKNATVYYNSAELTHTTSLNIPKGTSEVVIKNVANDLNENTVRIAAPKNVTIMSVQFTDNYVSEYELDLTSPKMKSVSDSIKIVQKEIKKIQNKRTSDQKTIDLLDKNQTVTGGNNGLSVVEFTKIVDYYTTKRNAILNNIDVLNESELEWIEKLKILNAKLQINSSKEESLSQGKLVLQIMSDATQTTNINISYITPNASWEPFYDLRADNIASPINLLYKAQVAQNTGIDWKKIKLVLSSGSSNQNNEYPVLNSWFLKYRENLIREKVKKSNSIADYDRGGIKVEGTLINRPVSSVSDYINVNENQLSVSFDIDVPYDILSNGKQHSVALKELKLPVKYKFYAAPRIEAESFLIAEINDYSQYNLLPGEANVIFEDLYVGKTYVDPDQTTEELKLSMGRDKRVTIKREKVADKSGTKFLSSIKEQTFTYEITVRNNKNEPIEMLLTDQYPLSTDKEMIVEVIETSKAKVNEETGILTWDIKLKPNATQKFRISYKIKYPKDKNIENL